MHIKKISHFLLFKALFAPCFLNFITDLHLSITANTQPPSTTPSIILLGQMAHLHPRREILRDLANHGHPIPLFGDWFRHRHVKQVWPLSFEEMTTSESLWGNFRVLKPMQMSRSLPPPLRVLPGAAAAIPIENRAADILRMQSRK